MKDSEKESVHTLKDLTVTILAGLAGVLASQLVKNLFSPTNTVTMGEAAQSFASDLIEEGVEGVVNVTRRKIG